MEIMVKILIYLYSCDKPQPAVTHINWHQLCSKSTLFMNNDAINNKSFFLFNF